MKKNARQTLKSLIASLLMVPFALMVCVPPAYSQTFSYPFELPPVGVMVNPSPAFVPVMLKGMTIYPNDPLRFDFIVDTGNTNFSSEETELESERLVKYFLAAMTVPQNDLWVNLSPQEADRIVPDGLGKTELGRDMLAQDYILKQLTASLLDPQKDLGRDFWDRVYAKVRARFGTAGANTPIDTFNKVWIMPDEATVYENNNVVYIVKSRLKVLLEQDYQAMQQAQNEGAVISAPTGIANDETSSISSQITREIIIPEIEKEVNEGENFAPIRQIYQSLILAKWYKETVTEGLLSNVYIDQNKIKGVDTDDPNIKEKIYAQYIDAFRTGVINVIEEDYDPVTQEIVPKKYFSGGEGFREGELTLNRTSYVSIDEARPVGRLNELSLRIEPAASEEFDPPDRAMRASDPGNRAIQMRYPARQATPSKPFYWADKDTWEAARKAWEAGADEATLDSIYKNITLPTGLPLTFRKVDEILKRIMRTDYKLMMRWKGETKDQTSHMRAHLMVLKYGSLGFDVIFNGNRYDIYTPDKVRTFEEEFNENDDQERPPVSYRITYDYDDIEFGAITAEQWADQALLDEARSAWESNAGQDVLEKIYGKIILTDGTRLTYKMVDVLIKRKLGTHYNYMRLLSNRDKHPTYMEAHLMILKYGRFAFEIDSGETYESRRSPLRWKHGAVHFNIFTPDKQRLFEEEFDNLVIPDRAMHASVNDPVSGEVETSKTVGGIDMEDIEVKREGNVIDIQFDPAAMQNILQNGVEGFVPVIINLTPIPSVFPILGLSDPLEPMDRRTEDMELSSI